MQLVLHTGAHFTEEERLMRCLLRNHDALAARGVAVPGPGRYRKLFRDTFNALRGSAPSPEARDVLMDAIMDEAASDRLILSHSNFFGAPRAAIRQGLIYPTAPERLVQMSQMFPSDEIELFMALRNPASFLPLVFEKSPKGDMEKFMGGVDPRVVRWSDTLTRIREAAPQVNITVWCSEDAPLIWAQVIREMAGFEHNEAIIGAYDLLSDIISKTGMDQFTAYMDSHTDMTEVQNRRVIAAFLEKFALDEEIEEELDMPGWDLALIDDITEVYDEDIFAIDRIPGVQVIAP